MTTPLFLSSLSGASARVAVIEESVASVWLYMTAPDGEQPIADCFLYNTDGVWIEGSEAPPPLEGAFASNYRVRLPVADDEVQIVWSPAGDAVAARIRGEFVGFIGPHDLRGYSRSVTQDCPWAHRFDVDLFRQLFGDG